MLRKAQLEEVSGGFCGFYLPTTTTTTAATSGLQVTKLQDCSSGP